MMPITLYVPVEALTELAHSVDALITQLRQQIERDEVPEHALSTKPCNCPECQETRHLYEQEKKRAAKKGFDEAQFNRDMELFTLLEDYADKHDLDYSDVVIRIQNKFDGAPKR